MRGILAISGILALCLSGGVASAQICGDGICSSGEYVPCPQDCADVCGSPTSGLCCEYIGPGPGCNDPACCDTVCSFPLLDSCCTNQWEPPCSQKARALQVCGNCGYACPCNADLNGDGMPTMADISVVTACAINELNSPGSGLPQCDVNCDGLIDFQDVGHAIAAFQMVDDACGIPTGACCVGESPWCVLSTAGTCPGLFNATGDYQGDGLACSPGLCPGSTVILPGNDHFETTAGSTRVVIGGTGAYLPIPADFFFPGSLPWQGTIELRGDPLPGYAGAIDTVIQRRQPAPMPGPAPVEIEIIELSLKSVDPIAVPDVTGIDSFFDVTIQLDGLVPSTGFMSILETNAGIGGEANFNGANGGGISVFVTLEFSEVGSGVAHSLTPDAPLLLENVGPMAWQYEPPPLAEDPTANFFPVPGIEVPTELDQGRSGAHGIIPPRFPDGCCLADGTCIDIDPADCAIIGGTPQGALCTGSLQVCCLPDNRCIMVDSLCCDDMGGAPGTLGASVCQGDPDGDGADNACVAPSQIGACCLDDGSCAMMTSEDCRLSNGAPGGAVSGCAGDADGNGTDDACESDDPCGDCGPGAHWVDTCPAGTDQLPTAALVGIDFDGDCIAETNLVLSGPVAIQRTAALDDSAQYPGSSPVDGHTDVIDTEIVAMTLTGSGVTMKAGGGGSGGALGRSLGAIVEQPTDPFLSDSFFDVYVEVSGAGMPVPLYNDVPVHLQSTIDCLPPWATYFHVTQCIPLYDSPAFPMQPPAAWLVAPNHGTFPREACCLPDGTCQELRREDCRLIHGAPQGVGSTCEGDANGNGVDDACELEPVCRDCGPGSHWLDACPDGTDQMPTRALVGIDMDLDCIADISVIASGPVTVERKMDGSGALPHAMDTEIVSMSLSGGGVTVTAGAGAGLRPSLGRLEETADPFLVDSFFDVFVEVALPGVLTPAFNHVALHLATVVDCLPPSGTYTHVDQCIPLYDSRVLGAGVHVANLINPNHQTYPPGACCLPDGSCIDTDVVDCELQGGYPSTVGSDVCLGDVSPANGVDDACEFPACMPNAAGTACEPQACSPIPEERCLATCANYHPGAGSTIIDCACLNGIGAQDCHVELPPPPPAPPCVVPDDGSGTVALPPAGCEYLSPVEVHQIIAGLPPGTTIELDAIHSDFFNITTQAGGTHGGEIEAFDSVLDLTVRGTGDLQGFNRHLAVLVSSEVHTGPRSPGEPVQTFPNEMVRLQGEMFGDPDFCTFRVTGGTDLGLPSPGQTTLTGLGDGTFHVDSFFDITYQIEFQGCPGSLLEGYTGLTLASIHMTTPSATPPSCVGDCPPGTRCERTEVPQSDGSIDICCNCVDIPCGPTADGSACEPALCSAIWEVCQSKCLAYDAINRLTIVTDCECGDPANDCHAVPGVEPDNPCQQPDDGTGTVSLPPIGCDYLSPQEVHRIIEGLPPGTTIELDPIHRDFISTTSSTGGSLGGRVETFQSTLELNVSGTGSLAGFNRYLAVPVNSEVHTGPREPGAAVQTFPNDMYLLQGELFGDPDFCTFRVVGGTGNGLPGLGETTLTDVGSGLYNIDSFFDVSYRIEFEGCPGSQLDGYAGATEATIRMQTGGAAPLPTCEGFCPAGFICEETKTTNPDGTIGVCCNCVPAICEPTTDGTACRNAGCLDTNELCASRCLKYDPAAGTTTAVDCECRGLEECHAEPTPQPVDPCEQPDDGTGTVELPPAGCPYIGPQEVHEIINGLPPGTTIELDPIHRDFFNVVRTPGGVLGGEVERFDSTLELTVRGTGALQGFNRHLAVPVASETHTGPRTPGEGDQSFATDMVRLQGELFGDPDFCTFRVTGGSDFGQPSPGQTTLTDLGNGNFNVDSFFDVSYRIDFEGCPGSMLDGFMGITAATVRMATGGPAGIPTCVGACPVGTVCEETRTVNPDGTTDVCCDCVTTCPVADPPAVEPSPIAKPRTISMVPGNAGRQTALRVTLVNLPGSYAIWNGQKMWATDPRPMTEQSGSDDGVTPPTFTVANLSCQMDCRDWGALGLIDVYGEPVIPGAQYEVQAIDCACDPTDPANYSAPLPLVTSRYGDLVGMFDPVSCSWTPPNGIVAIPFDTVALIEKFKNDPCAPRKARADQVGVPPNGSCLDMKITISDIVDNLNAFRGAPYPYNPSAADPCNALPCPVP